MNNLLSNALKFTPIGGSVHVTLDCVGSKLNIAVRDTGPGVSMQDMPYIFERFYQTKQEHKPVYEGSGIGLAIVKELSQIHGGDAEVVNNPEGGCTVKVWLLEGESSVLMDNSEQHSYLSLDMTEEVSLEEDSTEEDKALVLVVEDQRELRMFIVENLGSQYRFLEAENGEQGVEIALEQVPDIIISDVMMPRLDGYQFTKIIKENEITSHIPVLLVTAKANHEEKIKGLECGADDYLTKPFSVAELQLRIKNRIHQQEALRLRFTDNPLPLIEDAVAELNLLDRNFIEKLNNIVRENIERNIDVSVLASEIGLSNSQLTRKLKTLMGITPANFIKEIRLSIAMELLKDGYSTSAASWKTGFEDAAYFSKVFKKHFGCSPSAINN